MAIKAGRLVQKYKVNDPEVHNALYQTVSETWETNRLKVHDDYYGDISFSKDDSMLASGDSDGLIKLWDIKTGKLIKTFGSQKNDTNDSLFDKNTDNDITGVSFNHDDSMLASGHSDGLIKLWNVKTGQLITKITTIQTNDNFPKNNHNI